MLSPTSNLFINLFEMRVKVLERFEVYGKSFLKGAEILTEQIGPEMTKTLLEARVILPTQPEDVEALEVIVEGEESVKEAQPEDVEALEVKPKKDKLKKIIKK
jgi:hypothetical protein